MPCTKCEEGNYKWGETGECKYDTLESCESANSKYNKMQPTPLGKKTYEEYAKELKEFNLSKTYKINLSKIDDIEEVISRGFLGDFVEEFLDDASVLITKARDTVKFDMTDAYTEGEGLLNELEADIKALGIDVPADVKKLQSELNALDKEITKYESKVKSFG